MKVGRRTVEYTREVRGDEELEYDIRHKKKTKEKDCEKRVYLTGIAISKGQKSHI